VSSDERIEVARSSSFSSIGELFSRTVEAHPGRPALVSSGRAWTYTRLARAVSRVAARLEPSLPAEPRRIAIVGNNHTAYVVAYLAAQSLGASTVEVGRHETLERLAGVLRKTRPAFVVTDRDDLRESLRDETPVASFEEILAVCESGADRDPGPLPAPDTPGPASEASVIFTSGTTGLPKGVVLSHGNLCFVVSAIAEYLGLESDDRYALMLPLQHTYGKTALLSSFAVGASVVLMEDFQNLPAFLEMLSKERCTVLSMVPYHVHVLLKWGNLAVRDLSSLRVITSSANKLAPSALADLLEVVPGVRVFSMYGLTESTTRATYVPPERLADKKESCGLPLEGVELRIVGEDGSVLPGGGIGEVQVRGPNVMQGYLDDPELTARTVVDGWLKTGDLGRLDEDGFLYIEGRLSEIIKCAGERIAPAEIEEVLMKHPGVAEAAVVAAPDPLMGEVVHAFVVPRDGSLDEGELRTYCTAGLSHHKIPRRYEFVDALPKTSTGKVKKHLLRKP
jgi:acyl-CoA synthetase (AMP-forming)/AMP-acid ligase II